jgi:WD40 repeat protein
MPNAEGPRGRSHDPFVERGRTSSDCRSRTPTEPILRIETGKHVGLIRGIDTDAANHFAVTASWDKTVRVWSLPEGRLMRVLRLPIDQGDIGKAYAVAISPDGATVAVGGWTGTVAHHNIFLFDRASGEFKTAPEGPPNIIGHLAYSTDGRRLAASLGLSNGIRVFDASNGYRPLPSDTHYRDTSYWASFDRAGRLVTVSDDEFVRLYATDSYDTPIARFRGQATTPNLPPFLQMELRSRSVTTTSTTLWSSPAPS